MTGIAGENVRLDVGLLSPVRAGTPIEDATTDAAYLKELIV